MAEIGIAASIVGLAGVAANLALKLNEVASQISSAGREAKMLAAEISLFANVLGAVGDHVQSHPHYESCTRTAIQEAMTTSKSLLKRLKKYLRPALTSKRRGPGLVDSFKWLRSKPQVEAIRSSLISCKMDLSILMTTLKLEWNIRTDRNDMMHKCKVLQTQVEATLQAADFALADVKAAQRAGEGQEEISFLALPSLPPPNAPVLEDANTSFPISAATGAQAQADITLSEAETDSIEHDFPPQFPLPLGLKAPAEMPTPNALLRYPAPPFGLSLIESLHRAVVDAAKNTMRDAERRRERPSDQGPLEPDFDSDHAESWTHEHLPDEAPFERPNSYAATGEARRRTRRRYSQDKGSYDAYEDVDGENMAGFTRSQLIDLVRELKSQLSQCQMPIRLRWQLGFYHETNDHVSVCPWHLCRTWNLMREQIRQFAQQVEGPRLNGRRLDDDELELKCKDGSIITPHIWDDTARPGLQVDIRLKSPTAFNFGRKPGYPKTGDDSVDAYMSSPPPWTTAGSNGTPRPYHSSMPDFVDPFGDSSSPNLAPRSASDSFATHSSKDGVDIAPPPPSSPEAPQSYPASHPTPAGQGETTNDLSSTLKRDGTHVGAESAKPKSNRKGKPESGGERPKASQGRQRSTASSVVSRNSRKSGRSRNNWTFF